MSNAYSLGAVTATGGTSPTLAVSPVVVEKQLTASGVYATGAVSGSGPIGGLVAIVGDGDPNAARRPTPRATPPRFPTAIGTRGRPARRVGYTHLRHRDDGQRTSSASAGRPVAAPTPRPPTPISGPPRPPAGTWVLIPGETRPMLPSEYSTTITNAHQLQLMELNLSRRLHPGQRHRRQRDEPRPRRRLEPGQRLRRRSAATARPLHRRRSTARATRSPTCRSSSPPPIAQTPVAGLTDRRRRSACSASSAPTGSSRTSTSPTPRSPAGDGMLVGALVGGLAGLGDQRLVLGRGHRRQRDQHRRRHHRGSPAAWSAARPGSIANSHSSATVTGGDAFAGGLSGFGR